MAELITIDDPEDPRLHDYVALTDVELRRRREPEEGLFIAEGEKVIRRARLAGYRMRSMLLSAKWIDQLKDVIDEVPAPVYAVTPAVAEQVTGYHVHRGALASMQRKPAAQVKDVLAGARRVAVFEDLVDHANTGAAFRNAAALGVDAVLLSPRCADPLYRRSVKVSMGAVLSLPYAVLDPWPDGLTLLRDEGFTIAALCLADNAVSLDDFAARPHSRLALVFGTEGNGLSTAALRAADEWVTIPMSNEIDSLNVAAASAVAFYATRR
ncbi:tRNA G18 (ribose-2'-O)-methylase SpoU [Streptacidiphilus sp. MAP12-20]|uniref:TrmH family RNA methyltransferase n=1 Tax=Streptacidiphilus sp. MAP12-20 TaxID=3156299 RepID=UPI003519C9A6